MAADSLLENGDLRVKRCRHGLMLYSVNDFYIGRSLDLYGEYSEQEVALYKQLLRPGGVVVDAGANIGALTVYFAQAVGAQGAVLAFEPQRVMFQMLCANLALNKIGNVRVWQAGLGASAGQASVRPLDYDTLSNFGDLTLRPEGPGEIVQVTPLDSLNLPRCDLIKIDVQGMEGEVLNGARATIARCQPLLYIENDIREKSPALIGALLALGYRLYWHLPYLFDPNNFFGNSENVFDITASVNMLALPQSDTRRVELKQITAPFRPVV